jgi:hypothetical protein
MLRLGRLSRFEQQVIMIPHQTIGMKPPLVSVGTAQQFKEDASIFLILQIFSLDVVP